MKSQKNSNIDSNTTRIAVLENSVSHINASLLRIEGRIKSLETKMDKRFDDVDERFNGMEVRFNKLVALIAGIISKLVHWT